MRTGAGPAGTGAPRRDGSAGAGSGTPAPHGGRQVRHGSGHPPGLAAGSPAGHAPDPGAHTRPPGAPLPGPEDGNAAGRGPQRGAAAAGAPDGGVAGPGAATPPAGRRPPWPRLLAALAVGAFLGAALTLPLAARRVDTLTLLATDLLRQLAETENELARLREEPPAAVAIYEVRLELVDGRGERLPPATEVILRRQLDPLAQRLVGENVYDLSPAVVRGLFDQRAVRVEETLFRLSVESMVLGPRALIRLQVAPASPGPGTVTGASGASRP